MSFHVIAPILVVFGALTATLLLRPYPRLQRTVGMGAALAYAGVVAVLVRRVVFGDGGMLVYQVGGIDAPYGISLVADPLAVFMLALTALVAVYAVGSSLRAVDPDNQRIYYHPLYWVLMLGVTGAFLTGDLFNLFVWFEIMLMASYVFVAFYGNAHHTAAAVRYVALNTVGGVLMLLAVGGIYATTGTLNMAELAAILGEGDVAGPVVGFGALLLATFALKAGLVPFGFWVPSAYRAAPLPVAATFAGVTKKVGIYAIVRVYFTVFGDSGASTSVPLLDVDGPLSVLGPALLVMGALSVVVGGLGAIGRERLEGLLAYSSIAQIGFVAIPIGIAAATTDPSLRRLGVLAGLLYAFHHALTKSLLFLSAAELRDAVGTTRFADLGGLVDRSPAFGSVFLIAALSLVGIPPLVGFIGKLFALDAAVAALAAAEGTGVTAAVVVTLLVLLAGATLTIVYATRAWIEAFWGSAPEAVNAGVIDNGHVALLATLAVLVVLAGVGAEPVIVAAEAATDAALDTDGYVDAVLGGGGA